jgi:hypothetical protein
MSVAACCEVVRTTCVAGTADCAVAVLANETAAVSIAAAKVRLGVVLIHIVAPRAISRNCHGKVTDQDAGVNRSAA